MKTRKSALVVVAALLALTGGWTGASLAQTGGPPPSCTNGDCAPPTCTDGDCAPPECTNGDCEPFLGDCCCVGENQPGDIRVCCCRTESRAAVTCRESLVLETGYPYEWHQVLAQETLDGKRPQSCDMLMQRFCGRPVAEVCARQRGAACPRLVKGICKVFDKVCVYRYCGPNWFPYSAPAPDLASCAWWDQIQACRLP